MKKLLLCIITFFCACTIVCAETEKVNVEFVRCVDGDTAVFKLNDEEVKYRFLAIDTPETVHPTKEVEEFGNDASEYTCNKLTNAKYIVVEYETKNKIDKYGRNLGWIWVDGSLLQKELVSAGYAEVAYIYGKYKYTDSLCVVQQTAKENANGIWSEDRVEGYCASIDLTGKTDTIEKDYDSDGITKEETSTKKTTTKKKTKNQTIDEKQIEKTVNKANDLLEDFQDADITNILFYAIIGFAVVSIVRGAKNKK